MKDKKSLVAAVALLFVLLVGVTIAYFQSSASFDNIFNTGTYKVVSTEVFESPNNWKPGEEIPKTITTKNEGTIDAAVRVSYTEKWEDKSGVDITSSIPANAVLINLDNTNEWIKDGNYYYYKYILEPNKTTSSFIKSVTLNPQLGSGDDVECTRSADGKSVTCEATDSLYGAKYTLTLTKETVQYDKYKEIWNTQVDIDNIISFYLNDEVYYARRGMTWSDYINSELNTSNFVSGEFCNKVTIFSEDRESFVYGSYAELPDGITDSIIDGKHYTWLKISDVHFVCK